jgi:hypothetical protein
LEKGTDFLERKSLRMSRIEATLSKERPKLSWPQNPGPDQGTRLTGKARQLWRVLPGHREVEGLEKKRHILEAIVFIWSKNKKIVAIYHAINPLEGTVSLDKIGKGIPEEW